MDRRILGNTHFPTNRKTVYNISPIPVISNTIFLTQTEKVPQKSMNSPVRCVYAKFCLTQSHPPKISDRRLCGCRKRQAACFGMATAAILEVEEKIYELKDPSPLVQIQSKPQVSIWYDMVPTVDLYFWVKLCVFIDFLGVALVIPLLSSYLRDAGVGPEVYGLMTSAYYLSQIIGSVIICLLLDTVPRRNMLILSFAGSALSYAIVGFSSQVWLLFFSRIIVGLVKQTITISTSILSSTCENHTRRAELMGHISAATTLAFIIGPTFGSILYSMDPRLPAAFATSLFCLNIVICLCTIPSVTPQENVPSKTTSSPASSTSLDSIGVLGRLQGAIPPVAAILITAFLERAMSSTNIMAYYESRYLLPTAHVGYVSSVTSLVALFAQVYLIKPVIASCGGNERRAVVYACVACTVSNFLESRCSTIYEYLLLVVPLSVAGTSIISTLSRSILSSVVPNEHMGKALSALGLLESGIGVLAPLYGAELFSHTGYSLRGLVAGVHYAVAVGLVWTLLIHMQGTVSAKEKDSVGEARSDRTIPSAATFNSAGTSVSTRRRRAKRAD